MKIKVVKVLHNQEFTTKDGRPYKAMVVTFENSDGEAITQRVLGSALSKEPSLKLLGNHIGKEIDVDVLSNRFGKDEIVKVNEDVEETTNINTNTSKGTSKGKYTSSFKKDELGMRIMNSLNNAVTLVGVGGTVEDVETMAREILKLHDTLREPAQKKTASKDKLTAAKSKKVEEVAEEEQDTDDKVDEYDY